MDYQNKYKKYKNKYLILKNNIYYGGNHSQVPDSRQNPKEIIILCNNEKLFDKKVLILCHPKKVTGSFEPLVLNNHHYGPKFNELFSRYKFTGTPKFETVDIESGGTYQDDAFSDSFINKHINEYDLIMVPDCDGPWYFQNNNGVTFEHDESLRKKLLNLCLNLTKMLKSNGIILFGKLLQEESFIINNFEYKSFKNALLEIFIYNNFEANTRHSKILIVEKNYESKSSDFVELPMYTKKN
jgi:hypothetical protein